MKVAIIGLGFRLGYLGYVFSAIDPEFEIVGYVDPAPAGLDELRQARHLGRTAVRHARGADRGRDASTS